MCTQALDTKHTSCFKHWCHPHNSVCLCSSLDFRTQSCLSTVRISKDELALASYKQESNQAYTIKNNFRIIVRNELFALLMIQEKISAPCSPTFYTWKVFQFRIVLTTILKEWALYSILAEARKSLSNLSRSL